MPMGCASTWGACQAGCGWTPLAWCAPGSPPQPADGQSASQVGSIDYWHWLPNCSQAVGYGASWPLARQIFAKLTNDPQRQNARPGEVSPPAAGRTEAQTGPTPVSLIASRARPNRRRIRPRQWVLDEESRQTRQKIADKSGHSLTEGLQNCSPGLYYRRVDRLVHWNAICRKPPRNRPKGNILES